MGEWYLLYLTEPTLFQSLLRAFFHLVEFRMYVASYTQLSFRSQLRRICPAIDDRRTVSKMNLFQEAPKYLRRYPGEWSVRTLL